MIPVNDFHSSLSVSTHVMRCVVRIGFRRLLPFLTRKSRVSQRREGFPLKTLWCFIKQGEIIYKKIPGWEDGDREKGTKY